jgi:hypothetical protein
VLEVYVHTSKLREQLRVLAELCVCSVDPRLCSHISHTRPHGGAAAEEDAYDGVPAAAATSGYSTAGVLGGGGGGGGAAALSMEESRKLLADLYARVDREECGRAHVWRILLSHALQPYLDALTHAIFLAQVEDYHNEFLLVYDRSVGEQTEEHYLGAFTLRPQHECPFFLLPVRTHILRTVQGLAVLRACRCVYVCVCVCVLIYIYYMKIYIYNIYIYIYIYI